MTPPEGQRPAGPASDPGAYSDSRAAGQTPPILTQKHYDAPSEFTPESLLREARRQKRLPHATVPAVCVLDPDGDVVSHLVTERRVRLDPTWACYHTDLHLLDGPAAHQIGFVPRAVGAPFAVLVAEELFAAGCRLLVSVTSAGQVVPKRSPPYFVLVERALRDEGTSYHYLPASEYSHADPALLARVEQALVARGLLVERGATWTTDAPFRETESAISACRARGILAVEMEAAALYAFARARERDVLCVAHVTNRMGREGDFEKGDESGAAATLRLIEVIAEAVAPRRGR